MVASKTVRNTDLRLTLGHVTSSATLAKIDPDTGLQQNQGPSRVQYMTVGARRNFEHGSVLATFSKADARDLDSGLPTPEAPRTIFDVLAAIHKLPFRLQARGEFEYVGAKPLGTGCLPVDACVGVPVKEFRGALVRSFLSGRMTAGVNFLIASGYTGQTTENFCLLGPPPAAPDSVPCPVPSLTPGFVGIVSPQSEIVGVRIPSYASLTVTYRFGRQAAP
jgi:hypothetical protein